MVSHQFQRVSVQSLRWAVIDRIQRAISHWVCLVLISFCLHGEAKSQVHVVELRALSRAGAQTGSTVDLQLVSGDRLNGVRELVFSHPGITATPKTSDPLPFSDTPQLLSGQFQVTIADDVPKGRYEVRALGRHGLSNPRAFLVSDYENQSIASVSHQREMATELSLNTLVHAAATSAEQDWFQFRLEAPTALRIELIAQQIDSRMIGKLKLIGPNGQTLATSRGADDFDPIIETDELPNGMYRLLVHDFLYRGGSEFPYQVLVRSRSDSDDLMSAADFVAGRLPALWMPNAAANNRVNVEQVAEFTTPQKLTIPTRNTWWFTPDQTDLVFELEAKKGQTISFDVCSERLGEPSDARLMVQRVEPQSEGPAKLHDLVNVDDSDNVGDAAVNLSTRDPQSTWSAPLDASYRVVIRDLDRGQALRSRKSFQLRAETPRPRFELVAYRVYPHKDVNQSRGFGSKLFCGGSEAIRVLARRRDGWNGPIELKVEGLPAGVTASDVVIAANQDQTQITLVASEDAGLFSEPLVPSQLRVTGRSLDGSLTVAATPVSLVWGRGGGREFIRSRITTGLPIAVSKQDIFPLSIQFAGKNNLQAKKETTLSMPIQLTRREGGKAACVLRARDLPAGVTAADVTIPADKEEGKLELKVSSKASVGTYSLWLQAETKIKIKPDPQGLEQAQAYRAHLQSLHDDPAQAPQLDAIKAAIAEADKKLEAAKAEAKEQELTVFIPSPNATFTVVDP